ncbi:transmembrane anchor protein [Polaromonas sp.]|uniref:transmembrane anchor protein n=1 Tax=Polaromonas sp. TaxID=1869339 RepID=UPI0025E6F060|nr:transmembrane anchor protein [Polaromonas sp.]
MYNTDLPSRAELPSSRQLIRSTLFAAVAASTLLTTTVLPAEYGIDPTDIGSLLGLKKMGEIKTSLANEAAQQTQNVPAPVAAGPAAGAQANKASVAAKASDTAPVGKVDEISVFLRPGQSAEIKLDMRKGAKVAYPRGREGNSVNFYTHGDPVAPTGGFLPRPRQRSRGRRRQGCSGSGL